MDEVSLLHQGDGTARLSFRAAIGTDGSIAVLKGNLAPEGAVIKHTACPKPPA